MCKLLYDLIKLCKTYDFRIIVEPYFIFIKRDVAIEIKEIERGTRGRNRRTRREIHVYKYEVFMETARKRTTSHCLYGTKFK